MMKKIFVWAVATVFTVGAAFAQSESTAYSTTGRAGVGATMATDYQAIGINPANLGFRDAVKDKKLIIGAFEGSAAFYSGALNGSSTINTVFDNRREDDSFNFAQKNEAALAVANKNFSVDMEILTLGAALQLGEKNTIAFSMKDRVNFYARINDVGANIAFLGANSSYFPQLLLNTGEVIDNPTHPSNAGMADLSDSTRLQVVKGLHPNSDSAQSYSELLNGSRVSMSWWREYNFAFGREVFDSYDFTLYAGGAVKLISGFSLVDINVEGGTLKRGSMAISPTLGFSFDGTLPSTPASLNERMTPEPIGLGMGMDIGVTMKIKRNLMLGFALNNFGQIVWKSNSYNVIDGTLEQLSGSGYDNYNIMKVDPSSFHFAGSNGAAFLAEESTEYITTNLPTTLRLGGSYEFIKRIRVGGDIVLPMNRANSNLRKPFVGIGGDYRVNKYIRISSGFSLGGNNANKINIPLGCTFSIPRGFWEAGIAFRDITSPLVSIGDGSTLAVSMGFLRLMF